MTVPYPEYSDDGEEILSYKNIWRNIDPQEVLGVDCFDPYALIYNTENLVTLRLTGDDFRRMFSALYLGSEIAYPDSFMQIIANFLRGVHCPPELVEQDCFDYPTYTAFTHFSPQNPYINPNAIPDGYLTQPFLINGENGVDIPNYEHFDILVPFDSLTLDVDWFDDISGQLPTIEIHCSGTGKATLKFLNQVAGGLVVVTIDNPPNLVDIIAGIVTGADNILDLNLDIVSLPPETAIEIEYQVDVVGAGDHIIYAVFLPILDDSLIPVRFGGGFRGVILCDFIEEVEVGMSNLRFTDCGLEKLVDGEWVAVDGWADWLSCIETYLPDSPAIDAIEAIVSDNAGNVGLGGGSTYAPSSPEKPIADSPKYTKFVGDLVEPTGSCDDGDKDRLWAVITKIVFSVHAQNAAFLTDLYNSVDLSTAMQKFGLNSPISAALGVLDAINLVDDILLTFKTNYDSAVTQTFLYDVCADLFCAATDCEFSFQDFADYVASNAGGSFDIATTTFLDIAANLFGQSTGAGVFYALSWYQIQSLGLGEKFFTQLSIEGLQMLAKTAPPDSQWNAYATDCYTHTGAWTVILDLAGDYVKTGSEFVYNMPLAKWANGTGNPALITQQYKTGYVYSQSGGGFINKVLTVVNSGAQFQDARIYWRKISGIATAQVNVYSNLYTPPNNTTTSTTLFWDSYKALRGVGSPVGSIAGLGLSFGQNLSSQSVATQLKYIELRGTGELPIFA